MSEEEKLGEHEWVRLTQDYCSSSGIFWEFYECSRCKRRKRGEQIPYGEQKAVVAGYYHGPDEGGCLGREGYTAAEEKRHAETEAFMKKQAAEEAMASGEDPEEIYDLALNDAEQESK